MNNDQFGQPLNPYPTPQGIAVPPTSAPQQIPIHRQPTRVAQPMRPIQPNMVSRQPVQHYNNFPQAPQYANQVITPQHPIANTQPIAQPTATPQPATPKISHVDTNSKHPFNDQTKPSTVADPIPEPKQEQKSVASGPAKPKKHLFRKFITTLLILAILGGIGYGVYLFIGIKNDGDKVAAAFFNFIKTASDNESVTLKGTIKVTSQTDELAAITQPTSQALDINIPFSAASLDFTYSSNSGDFTSTLDVNLAGISADKVSSLKLNLKNIDGDNAYLYYHLDSADGSLTSLTQLLILFLGIQDNTWINLGDAFDGGYMSFKNLVSTLKAKNITLDSYKPDFFMLAFPTNHVKKVSNNLYQVIIDTTRLKWFLDKFSIAKLDKIDIKGAPKLYVEIDNTGRLTRLLCQYNYEYYDITLNIYDIMYSADSLQVEQPQGATNLTPLIIDSVTEIE